MGGNPYGNLSFWHESVPFEIEPRPALVSDREVDVAIVGGGFTGLWTAYYLKRLQPDLRIAIVEAEITGFGASGRNGGWCLGGIAGIGKLFDDPDKRDGAIRLQRAIFETVDEVGEVAKAEAIDCHWAKGGMFTLASSRAQRSHLVEELKYMRELGFSEADYRWLEPDESRKVIRNAQDLGSSFSPHCAAIHPFRLARGLAEADARLGVEVYERTAAVAIEPRRVVTAGGDLRADVILCATEAYSDSLPTRRRALLPLHSMMIATEPLPESVWSEIGLSKRETFGDTRRIVIYGQRTADDRIAFGGRGAYFYGSKTRSRFAPDDPAFESIRHALEGLFPVLRNHRITHRWGGPLAVPRDWQPAIGLDRESGFAWAGGYVGEGVAASNLAGRTVADLILRRDSELVDLPWVQHRFPRWEPEPIRWLGASMVRTFGESLDRAELADRPMPRLRRAIYDRFASK
ncbi:MAG: FAD-dependent oxidoreductase [Deltaproteobacteria bacterium]|nr:FAD-dependent oxidoreductase [Deltaproteobacteria bacterium]